MAYFTNFNKNNFYHWKRGIIGFLIYKIENHRDPLFDPIFSIFTRFLQEPLFLISGFNPPGVPELVKKVVKKSF